MARIIIILIMCHLIGDYGLHREYISVTKGNNPYHLFVHCMLYCLPFLIVFGFTWELTVIYASHWIIDNLKARYGKINYVQDQVLHYLVLAVYLF